MAGVGFRPVRQLIRRPHHLDQLGQLRRRRRAVSPPPPAPADTPTPAPLSECLFDMLGTVARPYDSRAETANALGKPIHALSGGCRVPAVGLFETPVAVVRPTQASPRPPSRGRSGELTRSSAALRALHSEPVELRDELVDVRELVVTDRVARLRRRVAVKQDNCRN